jgi:hypothetical protein
MGLGNPKLEADIFEFQSPFRITGITTPVETKPDFAQLASQIGQLTLAVSQIHQVVTGQAFTRAAPVADLGTIGEDLRKLSGRLDDIESRLPAKTQKN